MNKIFFIIAIAVLSSTVFPQKRSGLNKTNFQIGMYALQPSPGTKGHQNGSVNEMLDDIALAQKPSDANVIGINAAIAYRHWDRVDHPKWDFTSYVTTYLEEMYFATIRSDKSTGIQILTPPLYSNFLQTPLKSSPENDVGNDRVLNIELFRNFIEAVLQKELEIVVKAADGNIDLVKEIISNPHKRPLGGWYLDDEPLVRNHDIEILNTMSSLIRIFEENFNAKNRSLYLNGGREVFASSTYAAFDADDLHGHPKSGRPEDGKFYNLNGKKIPLDKNKIYSVFNPGTIDVLMPDYYGADNNFWKVILSDIEKEFSDKKQLYPKVMPVIKGFVKKDEPLPTVDQYQRLINNLLQFNIDGIWFYSWRDSFGDRVSSSELWKKEKADLGRALEVVK